MTTEIQDTEQEAQVVTPDIVPKSKGGRPSTLKFKLKSRDAHPDAEPQAHVELSGKESARYLRAVVNGEVSSPSWERIKAAMYMLDHVLGKAKQKLELPAGGGNFYFQLVLQAQKKGETPKLESPQVVEGEVVELTQPDQEKEPAALSVPASGDG